MTGSELKTKIISSKKFLGRFVYSSIKTKGGKNGELELCDCLLEFKKAYIVIQIKEKNDESSSSFEEWFDRKVLKKAKDQIKSSIEQFNDMAYDYFINENGIEEKINIDRNKDRKYIIIFESNDTPDDYLKYYITKNGIKINFFSIIDFEQMVDNIVLPTDIFDFLDFRLKYYKNSRNFDNRLLIEELSSNITIFGKIESDIQVSDYFILKKYLDVGLDVESVSKFNYTMQEVEKSFQTNCNILLELMSFNRIDAIQFLKIWDLAFDKAKKDEFYLPQVYSINTNSFLCLSKPNTMSSEDFNDHLKSFLYECFTKFGSITVYVFKFELVNLEQICVSVGDVTKDDFMKCFE